MMRKYRRARSVVLLFVLTTSLAVSTTTEVQDAPSGQSHSGPDLMTTSSVLPPELSTYRGSQRSSVPQGANAPTTAREGERGDQKAGPTNPFSMPDAGPTLPGAAGPHSSFLDLEAVYLWTRAFSAGSEYQVLDPNQPPSITNSSFVERSKTYLLLHGFNDKGTANWILQLKSKLLDLEDCNVLSIEYDAGANNTNASFINAAARVPAVGNQTAALLEMLVTLRQQELSQLHVIGHCLGAHVGGIAGYRVRSTVGRITGLDPTGLSYNNLSGTERLDRLDADFVDVIHTSGCNNIHHWGDCMGIHIQVGHSDFWPNGGYYQPACRHSGKHHIDHDCNHRVSQDYFLESFSHDTDTTLFLARPDINYDHYCQSVQCGDFPQYMGINARRVNRLLENYFLNTSLQTPYAKLDSFCPSLLSWRLIRGSVNTAIVLLATGLVFVVVPAVALLFRCAKNHFVIQTVPYSRFEQNVAPPLTGYCSPGNQAYREQVAGGIRDSPSDQFVGRWIDSLHAAGPAIAYEGSIDSRGSRTPLTSHGLGGHPNPRNYGAGGGEVLSDEDFQECSTSSIDQSIHADLSGGRLILRSESVD